MAFTPGEAPGADYAKDKDYQLERALDVLRAGGDLSKLAAAPQGIVITEPGQDKVETAEADTPKVTVAPKEPAAPQRAPEITPGNEPKKD